MSAVYNPEADTLARLEALEREARDVRRRVEHAHTPNDKRALNKQLGEIKDEIQFLKTRLDKLLR